MKAILAISLFFLMACDSKKSTDSPVVKGAGELPSESPGGSPAIPGEESAFDDPILPPTPQESALLTAEAIAKRNADFCKEPVAFCIKLCNSPEERDLLFHHSGPELNKGQNFQLNMNLIRLESCIKSCQSEMNLRTGCSVD